MPKPSYSDEDINAFIDKAREIGIARAIKDKGYPSYTTALKWINKAGVEVPAEAAGRLMELSNKLLKQEDKAEVANKLYAHYYKAVSAENVSDLSLVRLTQGYKQLMETYRVIEGKTEEIGQKVEAEDDTFAKMLREFSQQPAAK